METAEKTPLQHPQVFLSFRGAEVRQGFLSHLVKALRRDGVNVYVGQDLMLGESLNSLLMEIEKSMIALVILSKRYTESSWCLEELVKIKERAEEGKFMVIPIYYKLNPSDVRELDGDFGINLWNHVKRTSEFDKLSKWKEALDFVSDRVGLTLTQDMDESTFVADVVYHVKKGMLRLLWDVKSEVNSKEADSVQTEFKFPGKLRKDDGLNLIKDDDFLGEANSDATSKLQDSAKINKVDPFSEENQANVSERSTTMATYDKHPPQHQVFINFRGAELRNGFISHLTHTLKRNGVNVYVEANELKGSHPSILFKRIEESIIALVVFSSRYAESRWCLDELLKIKELMDEGKLLVIPIFYKVEQSHVTNLKGEFGDNFWTLWRINRDNHIIEWKEALKFVASMKGIYVEEHRPEREFINLAVQEVQKRILLSEGENTSLSPSKERRKTTEFPTGKRENNETYLNLNKCHLFGMEQRMQQLEKKLEFDCKETRIIGVTGMHGIGKTTLAMMLHEKWNCKFIRCVPLLGIRKKSEEYGLKWLRKTLLEILLEGKSPVISDETTHGSLKVELLKTKIFAVLDDVSDKEQLEFLLGDGDLDWIKKGSKIVITMCDNSLLDGLSHDTYVVPELNNREAFQLFSYHAFYDQISSPTGILLTLSRMFVDYARGHPLALKLLGKELRGKDNAHWKYILERVPKKSNMMFQDVWRFSTDQLNEKQKDVFLDIVRFFKSEDEYVVRSLLDSGDPDFTDAVSEVKDLVNKFLITIADGRVEMNVPLYSLSEDCCSSRWLRMCNYKDIIIELEEMRNSEEANNVRGIFLNMSKLTKSIILDSFTFINMRNLRYLKIYNSSCHGQCKADCELCFPEGLKFPLNEVRYLHWVKFPLEEFPPDFRPENLVDLRLPYSKIKRVWKGVKETPRLKWVDLSHSSRLLDLSALSKAENLQRLNLEGCLSLVNLPVEIQTMKSLAFLNLRGCIRFSSLKKMNLISLKTLILSGCTNLKEFQPISVSLEVLLLDGTAIKELPPAINKLQRLVILNLKNCKMLESLPNCLGELKALEELILSGCSSLKNLSDVWESMKHLQSLLIDRIGAKELPNISFVLLRRLCLSGNDFVSLQADIRNLYYLNWLDVKQCKMLTSIPMLPPKLQYFDAHGCDSLQRVANPLALPVLSEKSHATFNFSNCNKLDQDAKDSILSYTRWKNQLVVDAVFRYNRGSISEDFTGTCFPGWKVPALFSHQGSGSALKSKLSPHWCDDRFTGIGLCAVILFPAYHEQMNHVLVKCICEFTNEDGSSIRFSCTVGGWSELSNTPRKIESPHVFIGFTSRLDIKEHSEEEDEEGCSHIEASFEFQVKDGTKVLEGCKVLKCGFSLVYAADEREDISSASKTVVIPERIENILGNERSSENFGTPDDILYESYSGLIMGREEKFFSEGKSDASPSMQKNFENERVDLLNEESSNAGKEAILLEKLKMHSLVGVEMSKDPGSPRRHRMWNSKDIIDKLTTMEQSEANNVRGIFLDMSHITKSIALDCMIFADMHNLLYLKIYDSSCLGQCKVDCNLYFPDGLEFALKEIRYLHWVKYPLRKLPPDFRPNNLVELRLPYSKIERVWEGVKVTPQLKWVDLSHSSKLLDLSALSKAENLQRLNLEGCTSLDELPMEIHNMKSLDFLNLRGCISLRSFPKINLISLKTLILSDCSNLKDFQLYSESVEFLHLDGTAIKELPLALLKFKRLVVLNLKNCKMLESLPNGLGKLKALDELILSGCSRLKNLPDVWNSLNHLQVLLLDGTGATEMPSISFHRFEYRNSLDMFLQPLGSYSNVKELLRGSYGVSSLRRLCLSGNDFVSLHADIAKFCNLKWLDVKQCKKLKFVPMLPPRLQYFDAHGCESLERVANPLALPVLSEQIHATFNFSNCNMLDQDAKDNIMSYTRWRGQLVLDELTRYSGDFAMEALIGTCFPGWEVPAWFSHRASGSVLEPKLLTNWRVDRFSGIALCAVIVFHGYDERKHVLVKCNCELKNEDGSSIQFSCTVGAWSKPSNASQTIESTHVFIGYTTNLNFNKNGEEDDKEGCGHTEASFEFQVTDGMEVLDGCEVLKCGFSFLYTTDELQVEPGVRGAPVEGNYYRAYSKNGGVMSNARGDTEIAERSRDGDGGCEIVQLPNKMIAHEIMREEDSNWFTKWEEELPSPEELIPLTQSLITPDLRTTNTNSGQVNSTSEFAADSTGDEPARTLKRCRFNRIMEESRFETSELQASFMMSTPLWSDSWSLCNVANLSRSIQIHHVAGIMYVALPAVEMIQLGDLTVLEVAGVGVFSGLSAALSSGEPPPMVDSAILNLFLQSKIIEGLELEGIKKVVITGHSTGGALAALTALWLLSQPSPPSFRLLCITFGSPLLGNQSLSSSISRSRLAHNFCHVVSIHDLVPRRCDEQFWPFGTYLFCSDNGGICLDNASSVRKMFLILNNTTRAPNIEEHLRYGHYVSTLSLQFLKSRSFLGGNISDNSYQDSVALAVESLGFSNDEPSVVSAQECIKTATRIGRAPILRASKLAVELGNVMPSRLEIQWYKERCDASEEKLGYYDFFKRYSLKRDYKVNMNRLRLARFWDRVFEMIEKNELPFDFHLGNKWIYASQFYQLLAEPLDIAFFYKHRDPRSDGHYLEQGNRPKRYELMDNWWRRERKPVKEKFARSIYASATQDTCFWAKLEEAKEWLDEIRSESSTDAQRRSLLWGKIVGFESYADTLVKKMEVSKDVLAERSSYSVWMENLRDFKFRMGNGIEMVVDHESQDAMET